jgi:hypothetical protein
MLTQGFRALVLFATLGAACGGDPSMSSSTTPDAGAGARASVAPTLKVGVDPSIFLPRLVQGYHPTAEELATSGKACATDGDCATSGGQVVFHCSTPYYGQAQCQGVFPAGDQVEPGVAPSCIYYDCPAGYECETEIESASVTCLEDQHQNGKDADAGHGGRP